MRPPFIVFLELFSAPSWLLRQQPQARPRLRDPRCRRITSIGYAKVGKLLGITLEDARQHMLQWTWLVKLPRCLQGLLDTRDRKPHVRDMLAFECVKGATHSSLVSRSTMSWWRNGGATS
jgi:hypothetical protein